MSQTNGKKPSPEFGPETDLTRGEIRFRRPCGDGSVVEIYVVLDARNADGVYLRGINHPLQNGDEVIYEACGQRYAFGIVNLLPGGNVVFRPYLTIRRVE